MIVILCTTCAVVFIKVKIASTKINILQNNQVTVIDEKPDPNISTFRPLDQAINSNIKYNGNGYMPCNGYVPCQVRLQKTKQNNTFFVTVA